MDIFYRRIEAQGVENIPKGKPTIFASNHTNALMDPLIITYHSGIQHYFMTRGDVFKQKVIGAIFRSWRMLPIFRMKDGIDTLSQNNPIMDFVIGRLKSGYSIIIFPEGSHFWQMTVQPLKKGLVRMAFEVLEQDPDTELMVVPVGLYYTDMIRTNKDVLVSYGKPISIRDFKQEETPQKTYNQFNKELRDEMKKLVINIEKTEAYEIKDKIRGELAAQLGHLSVLDSFNLQRELIAFLEETEANDEQLVLNLNSLDEVKELPNSENIVEKFTQACYNAPGGEKLLHIIKLPLYILAALNFLPVFLLTRKILSKIKDRTFHSSVKFGLGLLVAPLFALIQGAILAMIFGNIWILLIYMLLLPVWGGLFSEFAGQRAYKV